MNANHYVLTIKMIQHEHAFVDEQRQNERAHPSFERAQAPTLSLGQGQRNISKKGRSFMVINVEQPIAPRSGSLIQKWRTKCNQEVQHSGPRLTEVTIMNKQFNVEIISAHFTHAGHGHEQVQQVNFEFFHRKPTGAGGGAQTSSLEEVSSTHK